MSKMPKGGLLHAHLDATVNARTLLQLALKYPAMHVRTPNLLTVETLSSVLPDFLPLPKSEWTTQKSLTADTYLPGTWVPLASARETFAFGGPTAFDNWVYAALTINPSEAYGSHDTTEKVPIAFYERTALDNVEILAFQIWKKFGSTFSVARVSQGEPHRTTFTYIFIVAIASGIVEVLAGMDGVYPRLLLVLGRRRHIVC